MTASQVSAGAWLAFAELTAPVVLVMLVIGLAVGVLQTITQIKESSVPFVMKLAGLAALSTIAGPLMMRGLEHFAVNLFTSIPGLLHG